MRLLIFYKLNPIKLNSCFESLELVICGYARICACDTDWSKQSRLMTNIAFVFLVT